jgi:hypothetical protein
MPETDITERPYRGAATGEEARFFSQLQRLAPLTETIRKIDFRFCEDSDNALAVWITIHASADVSPSKTKIAELNRAAETLRAAVIKSEFKRWPYVEIKAE